MSGIAGNDVLGKRIRDLRLALHLTLKQLEEASDLSATHLSEVERGRTSPTVGALTRIARALGRDASYFIELEELPDVAHLPRERRESFTVPGGARVEQLTHGIPGGLLSAYRVGLEPGPEGGFHLPVNGVNGDAIYLVREGRVEATFGPMRFELGTHDAAHAPLTCPHTLRAPDGDRAEVIALLRGATDGPAAMVEPPAPPPPSPKAGDGDGARDPDLVPRDPSPAELGRRIKALRVARGLTLKELEVRGGISATHVSEIERGRASPTVGALGRIAHALGLRPAALVEPHVLPEVAVMRAHQRAGRRVGMGRAQVEPVVGPARGAALSARLVHLPPGRDLVASHRHEGEEWAIVLSGRAEARVDGTVYPIEEGDSIHFRAWREHGFVNLAAGTTMLLVAHRPRPSL
jgi:transcriptional regulator with XRE-family HTH domain